MLNLPFFPLEFNSKFLSDDISSQLANLKKIFERASVDNVHPKLLKGPETPLVDPTTGTLYVLTEEANLVSLTDFQPVPGHRNHFSAKTTVVANLGEGRPLGGAFSRYDGAPVLYVADTLLGLVRVSNFHKNAGKSKVETIASEVKDANGNESKILYANDVDVGPITGHVYFTDSSTISPERIQKHDEDIDNTYLTCDTMTAFKRDLIRGKRTGRLLRYKPETDEVDVLFEGIWFTNGVAVDDAERFVYVSETSMGRVLKYNLNPTGDGDGLEGEVVIDSLPGFPDGITYGDGSIYVAIPSPKPPLVSLLNALPSTVSVVLRSLLLQLPSSLLRKIKPVKYGGVAVIRNLSEEKVEQKMIVLQDPYAKEVGLVTGLNIFDDNLYMGSLTNDFVGIYNLK